VLTTTFGVVLLSRPATAARPVTVLVVGQGLVHLALNLTSGHSGEAAAEHATPPAVSPRTTSFLPVVDSRHTGSLLDSYVDQAPVGYDVALSLPVGGLLDDLAAHAPMMLATLWPPPWSDSGSQ